MEKTTKQRIAETINSLSKRHELHLEFPEMYNEALGTNLSEGDPARGLFRAYANWAGRCIDPSWKSSEAQLETIVQRMLKRRQTSDQENRNKLLKENAWDLWRDLGYLSLDQNKLYRRALTQPEYETAIIQDIDGQDGVFPDALVELLKESRRNGRARTKSDTGVVGRDLCHAHRYLPKSDPSDKYDDFWKPKYHAKDLKLKEWENYKRQHLNSQSGFFAKIKDFAYTITHR